MMSLSPKQMIYRCAVGGIVCMLSLPLLGEEPTGKDTAGHYDVTASMFSYQPNEILGTYRQYPSGSAEADALLMLAIEDQNRHFKVTILPKIKSQRFLVTVKIVPDKQDALTEPLEQDYDLSTLGAKSVEMARDPDGRIYQLNLAPRIVEDPQVKPFRVSDLHLENWSFPASPVIVNDQDYIGQLTVSQGPLAWCDIPGLAKIEFSLLRFKDAEPTGTLDGGVVTIKHPDGAMLRIANVRNGLSGDLMSGGPYQVWVRWSKPTETMDQYRQSLKSQIAKLEKRVKEGDSSLPPGILQHLEKMSQSDRVEISSFGVRQIYPGESVGSAE